MFNRFTLPALQVLFYARSEVSQLGASAVEPEHILLGVLDERKGLGRRILARTEGALNDVRHDIVRRVTSRERVPDSQEIPFSASSQRALQYAAEEADRLLHKYVGTEHLLLGLLHEVGSVAAEVLTARGLSVEVVRGAIVELLSRGEQPELHSVPFMLLVNWFEEILSEQVIDETGLVGIYGFELREPVNTPEALIQLLRDEAGLVITRERREISTLMVSERERFSTAPPERTSL